MPPVNLRNTHILQRIGDDTARGESQLLHALHHHQNGCPWPVEQVPHRKPWPRQVLNVGKHNTVLNSQVWKLSPQEHLITE